MRGGGGQHHRQLSLTSSKNRDSDASFTSSRPSISRNTPASAVPINDRAYQSNAIRTINSYLSSISSPISLKPPLPSAKDITDTIRLLFSRLDWPSSPTSIKLEEDLPTLLKYLNCPIKLHKSALKAPGTPHAWPSLLAVIHWLVQISLYHDHIALSSSGDPQGTITSTTTPRSFLQGNRILVYALESYAHYIRGDDEAVAELEKEFEGRLGQETVAAEKKIGDLEMEVKEMEERVEKMRSGPSEKDALEKERSVLEDDVKKFHALIEDLKSGIGMMERSLEEKEKELEMKVEENQRTCEENEELRKKADAQTVNLRDAERMKREVSALERDIAEAEVSRNGWEEKSWDIDATLTQKFKELENLSIECNQAIRRLKLGNDFQYMPNPKGETPAEVLGLDYKSTLKPALNAFADDVKKSSETQLEELISLQQLSRDNASKHDGKRNTLTKLQAQIDALESQLSLMKKELEDFIHKCDSEAKMMDEDFQKERSKMEAIEKEADERMKTTSAMLQEVIKQSDEETQMCEKELLSLVDSVSKYKEYMESKISEMKRDLSETVSTVANSYEGSLAKNMDLMINVSQ